MSDMVVDPDAFHLLIVESFLLGKILRALRSSDALYRVGKYDCSSCSNLLV